MLNACHTRKTISYRYEKGLFVVRLTYYYGFPCHTSGNNPNSHEHRTDFSVTLAHQQLALTSS